ncbi:MAG TPA: heavy-metal-associated domain-containing protein [Flavobacterium sp.]|nr:heavy-metal-associated domain-containing protein [Flavobacterium sp.]
MKWTLSLLCLALAASTFTSCKKEAAADSTAKTTAAAGKTETATFHIEGMSCAVMCAGKIQQELSKMEGVKKAVVDFDKKSATVEYDAAAVTPQQLKAKVEGVADGKTYRVSELKSTADRAMLTTKRR